MRTPDSIKWELEGAFRRIQEERMADVPILNDKLEVEAVAFEELGDEAMLGVLLTPWFMNLMHMPRDADDWQDQVPGEKRMLDLPGGRFEFIAGYEQGIGRYGMCSLFSPVFEFGDQATAVATAAAVMEGVLRPSHDDTVESAAPAARPPRMTRRELFRSLAGTE